MDRKTRKIQDKIRKMTWAQKLALMDWLNMIYEGHKEEQKRWFDEMGFE